jgi:outer membrane receptor protein involved in Fe transport
MTDFPPDGRVTHAPPPLLSVRSGPRGRRRTPCAVVVAAAVALTSPAGAAAQDAGDDAPIDPVAEPAPTPPDPADAPEDGGIASATGFPCAEMMDDAGNLVRLRRGGIVGLVRDAGTRETIIEGAVQVVGGRRVFTNMDGCFQIELPPGTYTLRVSYDLYQTARVQNVVVRRGEATEVTVDLQPDTETLQEVVVTARADRATEATQLELRRQSASVSDAISAQEIARSPDNTASEAVRRVVAATIVGGQYLYVRGLGGRYTNTLMNGAPLPSLDPDAPGVQLDLFPSNVLTALTIYKTFTPDLPADMVGGAMSISTREFPTRFKASLGLSLGLNTMTTFADALGYRGGALDWLGFDDGTRALPSAVPRDRAIDRTTLSAEQLTTIGRSFQNVWNLERTTAPPAFRVSASVGDTVQVGGRDLGYLLTATYGLSNQRLRETVAFQQLAPSPEDEDVLTPQVVERLSRESMQTTASLGVLGTLSYRLGEHDQLSLTSLFANAADNYAGFVQGRSEQFGDLIAARRLRWLERNTWWNQLAGEHKRVLGSARLRWQFSANTGRRAEPDTRDLTYGSTPAGYAWLPSGLSGRIFSELDQRDLAGSSDLAIPMANATLKVGGAFRETSREFSQRRFRYDVVGSLEGLNYLPPEQLFGTLDERRFWNEFTRPDDGYRARQGLQAAFAMIDWPVTDWLRITGGVRAESFRQVIDNRSEFVGAGGTTVTGVEVRRTNVDALPSAALILRPAEGLYIRTSYGRTVARPLVRELALVQYPDFVRRRNVVGNPELRRTIVDAVDARVEWFPSSEEVIAASFFYKTFVDPIESVIQGRNNDFSFQNARGATNYGAEFELRLSLGRFTEALRMFGLGANFTLVQSEVELYPEDQRLLTSLSRPLAGQSPYVANVSLGIAPPETGFSARLYYNVFGPRLIDVGKLGLPDIYQQPFHSLDLTVTWEATRQISIKGSIENLLNDDFRLEQGGELIQGYEPGLTFGVGLTYTP